ncbi:MAG: hypothetical protein H6833_06125 [Planctomycetes bacterium]|nr:hypothetical protein [Planctomycetota bacterium]
MPNPWIAIATCLLATASQCEDLSFPDDALTLTLPAGYAVVERHTNELAVRLTLEHGGHRIEIAWQRLSPITWDLTEPEDVLELWRNSNRTFHAPVCSRHVVERTCRDLAVKLLDREIVALDGFRVEAASRRSASARRGFATARIQEAGMSQGQVFSTTGFGSQHAYALTLVCRPLPGGPMLDDLRTWVETAVQYDGPPRDPRWTGTEARERWERETPASLHCLLRPPIRTPHFLILSNGTHGPRYAELLERAYRDFRRRFPFQELPGRRLLPVVLVRNRREFVGTLCGSSTLRGYARNDVMVTWYANGSDPVHRHELAHQLVTNRLRLGASAWWFQEGLAECFASRRYDLDPIARLVARDRAKKLSSLLQTRSLREGAESADALHERYSHCALFAEFLLEGKVLERRRSTLLERLGTAPRNAARSTAELQSALRGLYGMNLDELEVAFTEYARRRR